ncbi:unnamed protein product [Anisakis simplex]|uniref:Uncharacterized protein n=1 Tax=Anisakis simplex TaxID=6269 RepID=A0A0M3KKL5_ANISI|nr:unnamed protein product [Anisakis simplex]
MIDTDVRYVYRFALKIQKRRRHELMCCRRRYTWDECLTTSDFTLQDLYKGFSEKAQEMSPHARVGAVIILFVVLIFV